MKEKLLKRLEEVNKYLEDAHNRLNQANAEMNMLNGSRAELINAINMCEKPEEEKPVNNDDKC